MTASLADLILHLHPQAHPLLDFAVVAAADGTQSIARWNTAKLGAQPGFATLEGQRAATEAALLAALVPPLTARQLRLWLLGAGVSLEAVEAQIEAIADPAARAAARVEWEHASEYRHDHPLVTQIGAALGLGTEDIRGAFIAGATL